MLATLRIDVPLADLRWRGPDDDKLAAHGDLGDARLVERVAKVKG